jgi:uncharacterized coiled-coil DUF342 family protein
MADEASEARPKRKYTRRTTTSTTTTRRRRATGNELVENLNNMVDELIKENRKLRRQIDKLNTGVSGAASGVVEKGLRSIQRRLQRAVASGTTTTRRRRTTTTASTNGRRRATTTRRRRTSSSTSSASS